MRWSLRTPNKITTQSSTWVTSCVLPKTASNNLQWVVVIHSLTKAVTSHPLSTPRARWKAPQLTRARAVRPTSNRTVSRGDYGTPCGYSLRLWILCPCNYRLPISFCIANSRNSWSRTTPCSCVTRPRRPQIFWTSRRCSPFKRWTIAMKMRETRVTRGKTWTRWVTSRSLTAPSRHLTPSTRRPLATRRHLVETKTSLCHLTSTSQPSPLGVTTALSSSHQDRGHRLEAENRSRRGERYWLTNMTRWMQLYRHNLRRNAACRTNGQSPTSQLT